MYKFWSNSILLFVIGLFVFFFKTSYGVEENTIITIYILSAVVLFLFYKDKQRSFQGKLKLLHPSLLLILGMLIIAYQNSIDLLLGNYDANYSFFLHQNLISPGVAYASIAIASFVFGYTNTSTPLKHSTTNNQAPLDILVFLSFAFTLLFLTTIDQDFLTGKTYIESGTLDSSHTNNSEILLGICNAAVIIQYALNNVGRKMTFRQFLSRMPKLFLILLMLYLTLRLISGAREPVIRNGLLLIFSYIYICREQPLKNITIIFIAIIASFVLSIISIGRGVITNDISEKYKTGLTIYETRESFSPTTSELAGSQFCDMIAINEFEKKGNEHLHGAIQGRYLAVILMPNRILNQIWPVDTSMQGSAYYITTIERGSKSEVGLGTTLQTDFYVDFGIIGMIICLIVIGIIFKKIDLSLYSNPNLKYSLLATTLIISISAGSFYLSRSAFIPSLKLPLYTFILLYINSLIYNRR